MPRWSRAEEDLLPLSVPGGNDGRKRGKEAARALIELLASLSCALLALPRSLCAVGRGLWLVADKRQQRIHAIADWLAASSSGGQGSRASYSSDPGTPPIPGDGVDGYDVVALQELWVREDFDLVAERAKEAGLVHSRFFYRCAPSAAQKSDVANSPSSSSAVPSGRASPFSLATQSCRPS